MAAQRGGRAPQLQLLLRLLIAAAFLSSCAEGGKQQGARGGASKRHVLRAPLGLRSLPPGDLTLEQQRSNAMLCMRNDTEWAALYDAVDSVLAPWQQPGITPDLASEGVDTFARPVAAPAAAHSATRAPITPQVDEAILSKDTYWGWRRLGVSFQGGQAYLISDPACEPAGPALEWSQPR